MLSTIVEGAPISVASASRSVFTYSFESHPVIIVIIRRSSHRCWCRCCRRLQATSPTTSREVATATIAHRHPTVSCCGTSLTDAEEVEHKGVRLRDGRGLRRVTTQPMMPSFIPDTNKQRQCKYQSYRKFSTTDAYHKRLEILFQLSPADNARRTKHVRVGALWSVQRWKCCGVDCAQSPALVLELVRAVRRPKSPGFGRWLRN